MKVTAIILLALFGYCSAHSLRLCKEEDDKTYIGGTSFEESPKLLQKIVKYVDIPEMGSYKQEIDCIIVDDLKGNENSGEVAVIDGGLSFKYVKFKFTSNFGGGMNYKISIFAKAEETTTETVTTA